MPESAASCPWCFYDIDGLPPDAPCPECGGSTDRAARVRASARRRKVTTAGYFWLFLIAAASIALTWPGDSTPWVLAGLTTSALGGLLAMLAFKPAPSVRFELRSFWAGPICGMAALIFLLSAITLVRAIGQAIAEVLHPHLDLQWKTIVILGGSAITCVLSLMSILWLCKPRRGTIAPS